VEITVEDAGLGIALEGAAVRSWDGGEWRCDAEGKVRLQVPGDRRVVIRVSYPGYENGSLLVPLEGESFTIALRLGGIMEGRELVIEAPRLGTSETRSGRSVAISGRELARTAEIGIVEDVMTSIKLLPGVGYTGSLGALPSIRGGEPGDLTAVLDGFYIERPYHWGGLFSIFDPKMVESARLSHGVFSARYGHTISGLLEVSSKRAHPEAAELELGLSTSAVNLSLSYPLGGRGGLMAMGRVTYWDPYVELMKLFVDEVRYVRRAPYIRSAAFSGYYRFSGDLEWNASAFFGSDGIGVSYDSRRREPYIHIDSSSRFDYYNLLGFLVTGLTFNPADNMVLKTSLGTGFYQTGVDGKTNNETKIWNNSLSTFYPISPRNTFIKLTNSTFNYQARADFDGDRGGGVRFAAGGQELVSQWLQRFESLRYREVEMPPGTYTSGPLPWEFNVHNRALNSSAYSLLEYSSENQKFGAELGLRIDHLYFIGRDFTIQTVPAFNPRLNLDFGILKNRGIIDSLSATAGTGLFSSLNNNISAIENRSGINNFELKQNRSWTSLLGLKIDLAQSCSFNIEGYFKYVFDRAYQLLDNTGSASEVEYYFDGKGLIWGFDLMLQKFESPYWDGWLSYSFNYTRYRDPHNHSDDEGSPATNWYYPSYHRFHYLNLVLNFKPLKQFHIAFRTGLASGVPIRKTGTPAPYQVNMDSEKVTVWEQDEWYSDSARTTLSIPMDIKFSFFRFNRKGRVQSEIYLSIENTLSLFYMPKGNTSFNRYTGQEEKDSEKVSYELPIPMISFGFKWSY
jgi:hypothetical protein